MKLSDLHRLNRTYNWHSPDRIDTDSSSKTSPFDQPDKNSITYAQYDNNATEFNTGQAEESNMDPLSYRHDMATDDYSIDKTFQHIDPNVQKTQQRIKDPGHTETPKRSQEERGNYKGLPSRSGNQAGPPSKIRHRRYFGIPLQHPGLT